MPLLGGIYSGVDYYAVDMNNNEQIQQMDDFLQDFVDRDTTDSIVSLFVMPSRFFSASPTSFNIAVTQPTTIDGYTPKNNKLFTYPYCFLRVDNCTSSQDYRFEYSMDETSRIITFQIMCSLTASPEILCSPMLYNGFTAPNTTESLTMSGFPQCAFSIDTYRAWIAQQGGAGMYGLQAGVKTLVAGLVGAATGGVGGALVGALGAGASTAFTNATEIYVESQKEGRVASSTGNPGFIANGLLDFYFKKMTVTAEKAKSIDDFFEMYGYEVDEIGIPILNVRPHWTYVKTRDVTITGGCDSVSIKKLCQIFDNGVRFWKNGDEVGNYSLDNSVTPV